jgi:murein DD-endopeptidase MepM/ murein hydrolase activator NlpD
MAMTLKSPLKNVWITQPFGVDWTDGKLPLGNGKFGGYSAFGMRGHNGIDFRALNGTEIMAAHDGTILIDEVRGGYGNSIMLRGEEYDTIYGHLLSSKVEVGKKVKAGDVIALSDNTGASTGPHLHFGLRPIKYDPNNGFLGWINPELFMEKGWQDLPVDNRYGQPRNYLKEKIVAFNPWLIRKIGRLPTNREIKGLCYGFHPFNNVFIGSIGNEWLYQTWPEYKKKFNL